MTASLPKVAPLLAKRRAQAFDHPDWLFELKYDGFRALLQLDGDARLVSRNGNRFSHLDALAGTLAQRLRGREAIIDGEVVCVDASGRPVFLELLRRRANPCFVAFDLLWLDGEDLRPLPLRERKRRLKRLLPRRSPLIVPPFGVAGRGRDLMAAIAAQDLEGIVAKRHADPYGAGVTWWKIKNPGYSQAAGRGALMNASPAERWARRRARPVAVG